MTRRRSGRCCGPARGCASRRRRRPIWCRRRRRGWSPWMTTVCGSPIRWFGRPCGRSPGPRGAALRHAALAYALRDDRDRSVWHRAAASLGPDDEIARDLDGVADRARQRGGLAVAAAALERAAHLSLDTGARGARLIKAAELEHELGSPESGNRASPWSPSHPVGPGAAAAPDVAARVHSRDPRHGQHCRFDRSGRPYADDRRQSVGA